MVDDTDVQGSRKGRVVIVDAAEMAKRYRTVKVTFSFEVEPDADDDQVADAVFDELCNWPDAPYLSCDGWDLAR